MTHLFIPVPPPLIPSPRHPSHTRACADIALAPFLWPNPACQTPNPLFRSLSESERRAVFVEHFGRHPEVACRNHDDLQELEAIRTARGDVGCHCHFWGAKEIKKLTLKRLKEELALRQVGASVCVEGGGRGS